MYEPWKTSKPRVATGRRKMTPAQRIALEYLAGSDAVRSLRIGQEICTRSECAGSNLAADGVATLARLRRMGFVIPHRGLWRITKAGRAPWAALRRRVSA